MFKWAMFLKLDFLKGILLVLYGMECKRVERISNFGIFSKIHLPTWSNQNNSLQSKMELLQSLNRKSPLFQVIVQ